MPPLTDVISAGYSAEGEISIWACVTTYLDEQLRDLQPRTFIACKTGDALSDECDFDYFVGTVVANSPPRYPWTLHIFEVR